ncbi:MAG: cell division protein FtsH [Alphaproteobacteria bacterium CG11_big_fil_rev_8_21_14_0_20_39_49]|nr:MAG: cell division protein FtsH [Alphaproteobacteria bacterium CG11_big_fil_rev_8_21_14_0_20_39_49]
MGAGKSFFFWIILIIVMVMSYDMMNSGSGSINSEEVGFSDFLYNVEAGRVQEVQIRGSHIIGTYNNETSSAFKTYKPDEYPGLIDVLKNNNVKFEIKPAESFIGSLIGFLLTSLLPIFLLIGAWILVMKHMQGGGKGGGAMGFGRSKARLMDKNKNKVTFNDVAGIEEAKEELHEIVDFLKDPQKFGSLGGKIPRGCLLVGSPGTGKTLLARAIAGEAGVPFFSISGSDFVEMFVGVGASRVRDLFEQGKKNAPCLIFIDEIDAVGRHRGAGLGGGNDEREQTLNQLLVEMDGFEENQGVIIIAATNRPDVLDPALLRPGRFDRQIVVPLPDILGRTRILEVHMQKVPLAPDVDAKTIARGTPGFTGADLANLVNEAALLAARKNRKVVTMHEMEEAKDKVMMGAERKSMVMDEEEKKLTAYHEAGHAVVSIHCTASDPIHKATIIPRGRALGMVMRLPEKDKLSLTREKAKADMAVAMGGRVAEEMIFGYEKVTSGASSDIKMATNLARSMVTQWGMSDKIGPIFHASNQDEVFLGHSVTQQKNVSEETAKIIDQEVKDLVNEGYKTAESILTKYRKELETLAKALLEYETLSGDEIREVLAGKTLDKKSLLKPRKTIKKASVPITVVDNTKNEGKTTKPEPKKTKVKKTADKNKDKSDKGTSPEGA